MRKSTRSRKPIEQFLFLFAVGYRDPRKVGINAELEAKWHAFQKEVIARPLEARIEVLK